MNKEERENAIDALEACIDYLKIKRDRYQLQQDLEQNITDEDFLEQLLAYKPVSDNPDILRCFNEVRLALALSPEEASQAFRGRLKVEDLVVLKRKLLD